MGISGGKAFTPIKSYLLQSPSCYGLATPGNAEKLLSENTCVDTLLGYSQAMWEILTNAILICPKIPWVGTVYTGQHERFLLCLDQIAARQIRIFIEHKYCSRDNQLHEMSMFASYRGTIKDGLEKEQNGLAFLARQESYFQSLEDYLFITQAK